MNTVATGLQSIITRLQKEKDDLYDSYSSAIKNGEKYESIKSFAIYCALIILQTLSFNNLLF